MDPLSITAAVGSLVVTCGKIAQGINNVRSRYKNASLMITAITSECSVISAALTQIQYLVLKHQNAITASSAQNSNVVASFDMALMACSLTFSVLDEEVSKLNEGMEGGGEPGVGEAKRKEKWKYMWNEEIMKELLQQIRGQQTALNLLIASLHTESIFEVQEMLRNNNVVLEQVARRARSLRSPARRAQGNATTGDGESIFSYQESSVSVSDTRFDFDDQIVNAVAYRRALAHALRKGNASGPSSKTTAGEVIKSTDFASEEITIVDTKSTTNSQISGSLPDVRSLKLSEDQSMQIPAGSKLLETTVADTYSQFAPLQGNSMGTNIDNFELVSQPIDLVQGLQNKEKHSALRRAIAKQQTEVVRQLLEEGAPVRAESLNELTPLHIAVSNGNSEILELLLKHNPDLNAKWGTTAPIHAAVKDDKLPIMRRLLDAGADIELTGEDGRTPLHQACGPGSNGVARLLINRGANIHAVDGKSGYTPLHLAVINNQDSVAAHLITKGASVEAVSPSGIRPIHCAASKGFSKMVNLLLRSGCLPNTFSRNHLGAIHLAASNGHTEVVELLIWGGANKESMDPKHQRRTPLHVSVLKGQVKTTQKLIDLGANIEARGGSALRTPLQMAVEVGSPDIIAALVKAGADLEAKDAKKTTALLQATYAGKADVVELLLQHGAYLEASEPSMGCTSLHLAALLGHADVIKVLLAKGAKVSAKTSKGKIPSQLAQTSETKQLLADAVVGLGLPGIVKTEEGLGFKIVKK